MSLKELRVEIIIPRFAREYGNIAAKYYTNRNGKCGVYSNTGAYKKGVPAKYKSTARYVFQKRGKYDTLFDLITKKYVIANEDEMGKGHPIKAQAHNTGRVHDGIRKSTFKAIKDSCRNAIREQSREIPIDWYPVRIDIALYAPVSNPHDKKDVLKQTWDCDNLVAVYKKVILDQLVNKSFEKVTGYRTKQKVVTDPSIPCTLIDDDRFYVSLPLCYWKPLETENHDDRYIKIRIRPDFKTREHPLYKQFHGRAIKQSAQTKLDL